MKRFAFRGPILLAFAAVLALSGCDDSSSGEVAGGEDFPNTVSGVDALARLAMEASDSAGDWSAIGSAPLTFPGTEPDTISGGAAGRAAATYSDSFDLSDTARGRAVVWARKVDGALVQEDTIVLVWNQYARDTVRGNEWIYRAASRKTNLATSRSEHQDVAPVAPDTMVTPLAGKENRIRLRQDVVVGTSRAVLDMVLDAGPDVSYETESDNRIFRASIVRMRARDTLETSSWEDGDGDSVAVDRATGRTGIVRFVHVVPDPSGVRLARIEERGRILADPRDSTANQPLRFERVETWRSGRVVVERVARPAGDSDLAPSDTAAYWREATLGTDTVRTRFDVLMGADLSDSSSRRLLGYSTRVRGSDGRILSMSFVSDAPVEPGTRAPTGRVSFDVVLVSGRRFHLEGRWDHGALSGRVEDGAGLAGTASWDEAGNLVAWKPD